MTTKEVEEVFTIESGNDLIDVHVIAVNKGDQSGEVSAIVSKALLDTSFLIFSEGLASAHRLALIKIGPDNYYAVRKDKSLVYKLGSNVFVFPPQDSVDFGEEKWMVLVLKSEKEYLIKQFNEIISFFTSVVEEVPGVVPELEAIKRLNVVPQSNLYPSLQIPATTDSRQEPAVAAPAAATTPTTPPPADQSSDFRAPSPSSPAKKIASGIVTGAEYIAMGINAGTGLADLLVRQGGEHLVNREMEYRPKTVDPKVISTLRTVRSGAETCCTYADAAVDKIAAGARSLGQKLVPHVQEHGTRLMSSATGADSETSGRYVSNIMSVTASGMEGCSTIFQSMTAGAKQLSKAVADETVRYVQRRYGDDAADATNEALYAAGNAAMAATAVRELAPKAIVKKAAREAATGGVRSFSSSGSTTQTSA